MTESAPADPVYVYAVLGGASADSSLPSGTLPRCALPGSLPQPSVAPDRPVTPLRAGSILAVGRHARPD